MPSRIPLVPTPSRPRRSRMASSGTDNSGDKTTITEHEAEHVEKANAPGRTPVVFVHGLWLLPSSWNRWADLFERAGYPAIQPGWPDDPETVEEANAHPEVFAHKSVGRVADHYAEVIARLQKKPTII